MTALEFPKPPKFKAVPIYPQRSSVSSIIRVPCRAHFAVAHVNDVDGASGIADREDDSMGFEN
jgi:hypothetical protein